MNAWVWMKEGINRRIIKPTQLIKTDARCVPSGRDSGIQRLELKRLRAKTQTVDPSARQPSLSVDKE